MDMDAKKYTAALSSDGATLAKVIATFSVVLTHSYKLFKYMGVEDSAVFYLRGFHAFAACGVPVFFLLAGYFLTFKDNWDYQKNLKKKFKSLAIPYCVFILLHAMISCAGSLILPQFFDDFRTFSAQDWLMHLIGIPFVIAPSFYGPLWFLRELFIFNVLSIVLVPVVKKTKGYILIPAMICIYYLPIPQIIRYSIPFFVTGMYFGFNKKLPVLSNPLHIIILLIIGFTVPIVFQGELAWKISAFLMVVSVLNVSEKLTEREKVKKTAQIAISYSFPIYLLHEYPMTTLMRLLALRHISIPLATAAFIVAPFVIIGMCVLIIDIWRRFSPKTYTLCTGGRQ